jgi:hypothetical protein
MLALRVNKFGQNHWQSVSVKQRATKNSDEAQGMKKQKWGLLGLLLCLAPARDTGGPKSGTIILTFYSNDKVVFATESLIKLTGKSVQYREDGCKIRAIQKKFIFASSGLNAYEHVPGHGVSWDGYDSPARLVARVPDSAPDPVKALASLWGTWMEEHVTDELTRNPEPILRDKKNDVLTYAMFAGPNRQGELVTYRVRLRCDCSAGPKRAVLDIEQQSPQPGTMGRFGSEEAADIADELLSRKSERARLELAGWKSRLAGMNRAEWESAMTVWAADFVIRNASTKDIGSPVDAVEMSSSGAIRWIQRKPNCPE